MGTGKWKLKHYIVESYVCLVCGIEIGSIEQAGATQRAISDAYRKKANLLIRGDWGD
jgi:hypothetical protein